MKSVLKRSGIAAIETEISNLASRRKTLEARNATAVAARDAARSARKAALGDDPAAELSGLTKTVRDSEDEVETLTGVLSDLAEQMADAERRLAEAKDGDVRAAAAKTLDGITTKVHRAAADLDTALQLVGKAYAAMIAAIPETLVIATLDVRSTDRIGGNFQGEGMYFAEDHRQTALPDDLARAVLAEGLARVCPKAFPYSRGGGGWRSSLDRAGGLDTDMPGFAIRDFPTSPEHHTATEAAALLISDRLRSRAAAIVAGEMSTDLADAEPYRPRNAAPLMPANTQVFALADFAFKIEQRTAPQICGRLWVHLIPEDAADAAVAAGVALRTDTAEGAAAFEEQKAVRARTPGQTAGGYLSVSDCHNLGLVRKPLEEPTDNVVHLSGEAA